LICLLALPGDLDGLLEEKVLARPATMSLLSVGKNFTRMFDQYSVICVFGSVVGCVVVPLITQASGCSGCDAPGASPSQCMVCCSTVWEAVKWRGPGLYSYK